MDSPQYKAWKDLGDNIGIQCLVCTRTRWKETDPTTDWRTGEPCSNCETLHTNGTIATEKALHETELETYQTAVDAAETPEEKAAVVLDCVHTPSQPVQATPNFSA